MKCLVTTIWLAPVGAGCDSGRGTCGRMNNPVIDRVEQAWMDWHQGDDDPPGCCNPLFVAGYHAGAEGFGCAYAWMMYADDNKLRGWSRPPPAYLAGWERGQKKTASRGDD